MCTYIIAICILVVMIFNYLLATSSQSCSLPNQNCPHQRFDSMLNVTNTISIVHISDTHNLHDQITLPKGDILIHTGDFTNDGTKQEYQKFNEFLGKHLSHFPLGIFVLLGNHDYKFLDGTGQDDSLIHTMADDQLRKIYLQQLLPNAQVIDNELVTINVDTVTLTMFGVSWTPFQSKPTYPEKLPKIGSGHYRVLQEWKKNNDVSGTSENVPNFYDRIPENVDILLSHIPPFGVFDKMAYLHWGSSSTLLETLINKNVRCVLFGHVHAQRGYWEKIDVGNQKSKIIGGCEYAKRTFDTRKEGIIHDLMMGKNKNEHKTVQFMANSALMSDRTVQPFAKKKIVGKARVIKTYFINGKWIFHCDECCDSQCV